MFPQLCFKYLREAPFSCGLAGLRELLAAFWAFLARSWGGLGRSEAASWLLVGRLLAPIGCPLTPSRSSKWLPRWSSKAILMPMAHFVSNLPPFGFHFDVFGFPFLIIWASFFKRAPSYHLQSDVNIHEKTKELRPVNHMQYRKAQKSFVHCENKTQPDRYYYTSKPQWTKVSSK